MAGHELRPGDEIATLQQLAQANVAAAKSMREAVLRSMASPPTGTSMPGHAGTGG